MPDPGWPGGSPDSVLKWQQAGREAIAAGLLLSTDLRLGGRTAEPVTPPDAARQDEQHSGADDREPRQG